MTSTFTKSLTVLFIILLSFQCKTFASIYYVNSSNPTPGTGGSWATAAASLTTVIPLMSPGDQVWVAAGTYKPTTTANRTATFLFTNGGNIYGGFNGTETALAQRNPTTNLTILSGDIGTPGDASDNSYHVITYESTTQALLLDGFTITGGNANLGYPGSTIPSAANTGGGFLELSMTGEYGSVTISNCSFTNNFAVYGGGFGAYGDGGMTFYGIKYCSFKNNSAYSGGAGASLGYNNDWSVSQFDMCVFINNSSDGSLGSAIATMYTNGTTADMLTMVTNCVMYDNPAPQLYNLATNGSGNLQMYCSIVWSSTGQYTAPLYAGNHILLDYCDLDEANPAGNINVDPQFTNAAAGDFHTPHCSPLIDQGFTTAAFNIGTTDPDGNARLLGPKTDIGLYESSMPPAPTVTNVSYCQYATAVPLQATPLAGYSLLWYTTSSGGTGSSTAITPSTATSSSYPFYYYVSQVDPLGCEGTRTYVKVMVNAAAAAPTAPSPSFCQGSSATALTATGSNLLWYTDPATGTGDATAPTPSTASSGTTYYYVSQTPAGSCESARTMVTVTVGAAASAPSASDISYCQGASATALGATGTNLLWYTASSGGTGASTAPTPSTASSGSTDYYVTQTPSGSCESPRTKLTVTVATLATAPSASDITYCQGETSAVLSATGTNLLWYTQPTGGTGDPNAPTPSTVNAGSTDYYVTQTPSGSCESSPTTIQVTVKPGASAPAASSPSYCQGTSAAALTATGTNLLWYSDAIGGTGSSTAPTPSTASAGTTSYYVSQTPAGGGCESLRAEVDVLVKPTPSSDFTWSTACVGVNTTINASATGADQYTWDFGGGATSSGSGAGPVEVIWSGSNIYTVTLTTMADGCQGQTQHQLTVNPTPTVGITPPTSHLCQGSTVTLEAYGASSYQWSPATDLSDAATSNPIATLESNIQYTVTGTDVNGCSATATVTLEINPDCLAYYFPNAFTPNGDGKNDEFRVKTGDSPKSFSLLIFNRYGGKVFESSNASVGWNGTIGGNPAPTGTYVFTFQATTSAGAFVKKQGTIVLVR